MLHWLDFRKHSGPTPADDMAPQIITDCGNFTLDFKQRGFCASPLFLQMLGPWFPNEMQNLLSSENRTLDYWATVQFFFSLAQVRCFWCLFQKWLGRLFPKDVWAWWLLMHWLQLQSTPCEALPTVWISFAWQYSQACGHPCCLCTFSYTNSSFQSTLHLICFDRALLTFTFMHLADAFIQSDLQCIQVIHIYCQYVCSLGMEPTTLRC